MAICVLLHSASHRRFPGKELLAKLLSLTRVGVGESMCAKKRQTEIKRETGKTRPILRPEGSDIVLISPAQPN